MTKTFWFISLLLISLNVHAFGSNLTADHVVIISIDGGKPASLQKSNMPILKGMIQEGASTMNAKTIMPSLTLPSHTSMLTGVGPEIHKITWNGWSSSKGTVKVPTVFGVAKDQGHSTALFATKQKFKHLEVKGTLDKFLYKEVDALEIAKLATDFMATNKPELLFVHMPDADIVGHSRGWESPQQLKALENVDAAIGMIKKAMEQHYAGKQFVMIISADHGGSGKGHGSSSAADMTIPWITWGTLVRPGHAISASVKTMDTAATALWLLGVTAPQSWQGVALEEAYQ